MWEPEVVVIHVEVVPLRSIKTSNIASSPHARGLVVLHPASSSCRAFICRNEMLGNWGESLVVQHHACDVSAVRAGNVVVAWCILNVLKAHIGVF